MGVEFVAETSVDEIVGWAVACACGKVTTGVIHDDYPTATTALTLDRPSCEQDECAPLRGQVFPLYRHDVPRTYLSGTTALGVLLRLRMPIPDGAHLAGSVPGTEFLASIDAVAPATADPHLQRVIDALRDIAVWCADRGRMVAWAESPIL